VGQTLEPTGEEIIHGFVARSGFKREKLVFFPLSASQLFIPALNPAARARANYLRAEKLTLKNKFRRCVARGELERFWGSAPKSAQREGGASSKIAASDLALEINVLRERVSSLSKYNVRSRADANQKSNHSAQSEKKEK
jgi:hypothetical protein